MLLLRITTPFMDPFWFNTVKYGVHETVVTPSGRIELKGVTLAFENDEEILPVGTCVRVQLNRWFECEPTADYEARYASYREAQALKDAARKEVLNARRATAEVTNAGIELPVLWEPAVKDVLSGLSEKSSGTGTNRATVQHIRLLGALTEGRLVRLAGDMLCTSAGGTNGKGWSNETAALCYDGDGQCYPAPVTCKKCLSLVGRFTGHVTHGVIKS